MTSFFHSLIHVLNEKIYWINVWTVNWAPIIPGTVLGIKNMKVNMVYVVVGLIVFMV